MIARTLLDAALGYVESKGWHLFPLGPTTHRVRRPKKNEDGSPVLDAQGQAVVVVVDEPWGKKPHPGIARVAEAMGKEGHLTGKWGATNDPEVLRAYFDAMPDATGIGLLCGPESGVDVLDIDGDKGRATLRGLGYTLEDIKALGVPMVRTGRDDEGFHAYFLADPERRVTSRTGKGERGGLDAKGGGSGYVVLPPSIHPHTGRAYAWEQQGVPQPWPADILEAVKKEPEAAPLLEQPKARQPAQASPGMRFPGETKVDRARAYIAKMPGAVSGQGGHDQTFNAACRLAVDFELGRDEVRQILDEYNARCSPPWSPEELEHKTDEAMKKAAASPDLGRALKSDKPKKAAQSAAGTEGEEQQEDQAARVARIKSLFLSPEALRAWAKERPREWIVEGLLPTRAVVFVTGVEKEAGKSSFVWSLVGQAERGGDFLNRTLPKVRAVVLTEEDRSDLEEKLGAFGITEAITLPQERVFDESMEDTVTAAAEVVRESGAKIVVIDTFAAFAQLEGDAESKSGVAQLLKPLRRLAREEGVLVLVIHHTSKNSEAQGIRRNRGSTALTGIVEGSLEVRASGSEGNERTLDLKSRWGKASWAVERSPGLDGFLTYRLLGDKVAVQEATHEARVLEWMERNPGWHRADLIEARVGGATKATRSALLRLWNLGRVQRQDLKGKGKPGPGNPNLYALPGVAFTGEAAVHAGIAADRAARNGQPSADEGARSIMLQMGRVD